MVDIFQKNNIGLESPVDNTVSVTPSDTVDLDQPSRAIYVGVDGDVTAVMLSGQEQLFSNMVAGVVYPIRVSRINATGTTATNIVSMY